MRRHHMSPIRETLETWPLAGTRQMRWGRDADGELWVTVESGDGWCEAVLPYKTYLDMERSRAEAILP